MKYILFERLSDRMIGEVACSTSWDIEHTLGARLANGELSIMRDYEKSSLRAGSKPDAAG
jgi:hypothetical protein